MNKSRSGVGFVTRPLALAGGPKEWESGRGPGEVEEVECGVHGGRNKGLGSQHSVVCG